MDYYLDTEFAERPCTIDLISVALVREDGRFYYAESSEVNEDLCNDWVKKNVLPKRTDIIRRPRTEIRDGLRAFVGDDRPRFWGYYSDYDWVVFCWLFGAMIDLPPCWPMYCLDLKQELARLNVSKDLLPTQDDPAYEHNALCDARWIMKAHQALRRMNAGAM